MRIALCALLLLGAFGLGACPARPQRNLPTKRVAGAAAGHGFGLAIPASLLTETAGAGRGTSGLRAVYSDATGTRLALLSRGTEQGVHFCNLTSQPKPSRTVLPGRLLAVDCESSTAWCLESGAGRLLRSNLAEPSQPPQALAEGPAGQPPVAAAFAEGKLFVLTVEETPADGAAAASAGEPGAEPDAGAMDAKAEPPLPDAAAADAGSNSAPASGTAATHSASPPSLGGVLAHLYLVEGESYTELLATRIGPADPAHPPQLAALPGGAAALYLPAGQLLWLLGPDLAKDKVLTQIGELGDAILAADASQPVAWLYARPQDAGAGSGREQRSRQDGEIVAIGPGGAQLARYRVGSVPFSQIAGDISQERCLLALSSAGVALASTNRGQSSEPEAPGARDAAMSWLLRHGGDAPLFLSGGRVWAGLAGGLYAIATEELIRQAPLLSAAQTLPKEQARALRAAADALSWEWKGVQVSPLAGFEDRLVLYDTASRNATTAELQWEAAAQRATHVLVTRPPTAGDIVLIKAPAADLETACKGLLAGLGWPGAVLSADGVVQDEYSAAANYQLDPANADGGSFSLWVTESVALITLEAAPR